MSRQAEAERDRRARVIAADGEYQAASRIADAAQALGAPTGALQLRLLQTLSDVASDRTNTVIMPLPLEMMRFFSQTAGTEPQPQSAAPDVMPPVQPPPPVDARGAVTRSRGRTATRPR
jgi:hypothetical protein